MAVGQEIKTERLVLAPFQERHLTAHYVAWLNDRQLMRYSEQRHKIHSAETCRVYWQSFSGTPNFFWAIEEQQKGYGHIGNINAYINEWNQLADIGIVVGEQKARGQGYALEAWRAVCEYLFDSVGVRKITAGAMANNAAMLKLMQRSGMVEDGVRRRHYVSDGIEVDIVYRALFNLKKKFATPQSVETTDKSAREGCDG